MSFLSSRSENVRYGVLIDVGSGSVLVAIVASDPTSAAPEIIWSKREYTSLRAVDLTAHSAKSVMTSLLTGIMAFESTGRKVLREKVGKVRLSNVQVSIAAPWSYTITKTINYAHDESFMLNSALVEELLETAHKKVSEELSESEKVQSLGLKVICRSVISIIANGYALKVPNNQSVLSVKIIESNAVAQTYLTGALKSAQEKVLPGTEMDLYSFMLVYYTIIRDLYPESSEYCLVDVTYEATELGIVRDGILVYTSHIPHGSFTLAREFAGLLQVPLEEAFSYLHEADPLLAAGITNDLKKEKFTKIILDYQSKLADLFMETGDSLAIPKKIYLHGDFHTEPFFVKIVTLSAHSRTNTSHAVYSITEALLTRKYVDERQAEIKLGTSDTALLISAQFFHTSEYSTKFEQL